MNFEDSSSEDGDMIPNSLSNPGSLKNASVVAKDSEGNVVGLRHWKWRARYGKFIHPSDMETSHLFHTLKMIWNHTMPEGAKLKPYRPYSFPDFYTAEYMACAIRAMATELYKRRDLEPKHQNQLNWMIDWLRTHQLEYSNAQLPSSS